MAPFRELGAWYFDAASQMEESIPYDGNLAQALHAKLSALKSFRSALVVELPGKRSLDLFVRKDGRLEMEFGDESRGTFGKGAVTLAIADLTLSVLLISGEVRHAIESAGGKIEYYEEPLRKDN